MNRLLTLLVLIGLAAAGCDSVEPVSPPDATDEPARAVAASANRSPSSDQGWFTYSGTLYYACVGEPIDMDIEAHYVWHSDTTPTGRYHYLDHWHAQMTGTGRYSGATYRAQESVNYIAHWPEEGGAVTTFNWTTRLIRPGSGLQYLVHTTGHVTQHADGTTSVDVEHDDSICRVL
jgi:hypothetical protein